MAEKEEEAKKKEQNCVLPGCRFVTLAMLLGDIIDVARTAFKHDR